ncbi:MAG: ABC transporter ATP-binding protein [Chloroflexota bacterium]
MSQPVIETSDLTRVYGDVTAVDHLNLRINEGEVFGFLGPNGAGKTTTILMLLGLTEPTSGNARICGFNPTREPLKVKRIVGYFPEKIGFYNDLTARQNLRYTADLNNIPLDGVEGKIDAVLRKVGLSEVSERQVGKFSRGMKQRLGIADVLMKDPKVVILDEPTSGIDPQGIEQILGLITDMHKQNITVLLSSHQLHQVQRVCSRVGILSKGRLVAEGSVEKLGMEAIGGGAYRIEIQTAEPEPKLVELVQKLPGIISVQSSEKVLVVNSDRDVRPQLAKAVVDSGALLVEMKIEKYGLEEIYMKYFKEG